MRRSSRGRRRSAILPCPYRYPGRPSLTEGSDCTALNSKQSSMCMLQVCRRRVRQKTGPFLCMPVPVKCSGRRALASACAQAAVRPACAGSPWRVQLCGLLPSTPTPVPSTLAAGNSGPVLLCLHGGGYTGLSWALIARALKDRRARGRHTLLHSCIGGGGRGGRARSRDCTARLPAMSCSTGYSAQARTLTCCATFAGGRSRASPGHGSASPTAASHRRAPQAPNSGSRPARPRPQHG